MCARATDQAQPLIMTAGSRKRHIRSEIARLDQSRLQLVDDIRAALDTYQQWLATVDPRAAGRTVDEKSSRCRTVAMRASALLG